jgi:predicted MPP superfamily phosphohydrolase
MGVLGASIPATIWAVRGGIDEVGTTLGWVAFPWMAIIGLTVVGLAFVDVGRLVVMIVRRIARQEPMQPSRRQAIARITGGAVAVAATGAVGAGVRHALGEHEINDVEVRLKNLGGEMDGFTIVQITDVHIGNTVGRGFIEELVERVNRLQPDLVAVTGDLVDGDVGDLRDVAAPLAGLRAKHGVYFVTGNHEYYSGVEGWLKELRTLGMRVLRNERVRIERGGAGFDLAGVDDHGAGKFEGHGADYATALGERDRSVPVVLLAHQPRQVHEAARHGVDLQISGHTHGGQIWPWHYIVSLQQGGLLAGMYRVGETQLHVSRGAGYWGPPVRVGAPPELTRYILRA